MITCPQLGRSGRLGNQLWQIASTLGIAAKHNTQASFPPWDYQPYFCIPDEYFINAPGDDVCNYVPHIDERARVYLQDYGLFREITEEIKIMFQPSALALQTLMSYEDFWDLEPPVACLHVRRGDNANEGRWKAQYHPLRPTQFYTDALKLIKYESLAIFSDDPAWCRETFGPEPFYFEGTPRPKEHEPEYHTAPVLDWIDLQLMSFCDYHILSNSTYSWWGAFLSFDPEPIYPWPWLGPALKYVDASLMFPPRWRRLNHGKARGTDYVDRP